MAKLQKFQRGGTQITAPSHQANPFNEVVLKEPERNVFNLSHSVNTTFNFGELVPVLCREVLPGDTWKSQTHLFMRFAPQLAPVLGNCNVSIMSFFVPSRLVYKGWETFISGGRNGDGVLTNDLGEYVDFSGKVTTTPITCQKPFLQVSRINFNQLSFLKPYFVHGSLLDYLGFPTYDKVEDMTSSVTRFYPDVDYMVPMAYHKIVNDYFINRNISDSDATTLPIWLNGDFVPTTTQTHHETSILKLAHINYPMDYFTSCLPDLQRGADVYLGSNADQVYFDRENVKPAEVFYEGRQVQHVSDDSLLTNQMGELVNGDNMRINVDNSQNLYINTTTTIQELRYLTRLQQWLETSERVGSRYIDTIKGFFGVTSSDARLQRAEYLGGDIIPVVKSDIEQTSASQNDSTALGSLAGKSVAVGSSKGFTKFFEEHGFLFTLVCCMPETNYINLTEKQFLRKSRMDYYWPQFANLSEQGVTLRELFTPTNSEQLEDYDPNDIFGYQQRYAEYRYIPSTAHGDFKDTMSYWTFPRIFDTAPQLNSSFLKTTDAPQSSFATNVVIDPTGATTSVVDKLWCQIRNETSAVRPVAKYAVPSL